MKCQVDLLVVGMRKSGTSWLYENCINQNDISVNTQVKETGLFRKNKIDVSDIKNYNSKFTNKLIKAEFDASLCYEENYINNIMNYTKDDVSLRLVVRNPVDYLVSRFIHSKRKGEIGEVNMNEAIEEYSWLRNELDYLLINERFQTIERTKKAILPFEMLCEKPDKYINKIFSDINLKNNLVFDKNKINVARNTSFPIISEYFAKGAKLSRKLGMHSIVNIVKSSGINNLLENHTCTKENEILKDTANKIIMEKFRKSFSYWEEISEYNT